MRVLVVEDYRPLAAALTQGLREQGYAVDASHDGAEGLWYAQEHRDDTIVVELPHGRRVIGAAGHGQRERENDVLHSEPRNPTYGTKGIVIAARCL